MQASLSTPPESTNRSPAAFLLGCCVVMLITVIFGVIFHKNTRHSTDFRVYYSAGYMLRTEPAALYDFDRQLEVQNSFGPNVADITTYLHPPYEALWFAPFTLLPYHPAYYVYTAASTLLLIATFFVARPLFSEKIPWLQPRPGLMLLLFLPLTYSILWGQDSVLFLFLCTLAWRQLDKGKDLIAGCILALALFRFQLALPIAVIMAVRLGWRFSGGFLGSAIAVCLLNIALVGKAGMVAMVHLLGGAALIKDQGFHAKVHNGIHPRFMTNLAGLLYSAGTRLLPAQTAFIIVMLASLGVFLWTVYYARRIPETAVAYAMAILCCVLVSYHLYIYDYTLIVLALALLARRVRYAYLAVFFVLPVLIPATIGFNWLFLIAIPLLALLGYAGLSRSTRFSSINGAPTPTPLYT